MNLDNCTVPYELKEECEGESIIIKLDDHFGSSALTNFYRSIPKYDSKLINHLQFLQLFKGKHFKTLKTAPQLLYRATRDGFSSESFHTCCDGHSKVVIIVKTQGGDLFGGYTSLQLEGTNTIRDDESFTFIFENDKFYTFRLQPSYKESTLFRYEKFNATYLFAFGYCFWVSSNADKNNYSGSHHPESYILEECRLPKGSNYFFRNSKYVEDLEVHQIIN